MQPVISCPQPSCGLPAQILDRWTWDSTDGPVEHVKTCCPDDHWFTPALETLTIHPTMNRSPEPGTVVPVGSSQEPAGSTMRGSPRRDAS